MPSPSVQHVVVGAVFNGSNEVLLAFRPPTAPQGGLWEFPGGKIEAGESAQHALARELQEEIGISVISARPLIRIRHHYHENQGSKTVLLDVWRVDAFAGKPFGREGQPVEWVAVKDLAQRHYPAANWPIVNAVRLPSRYLITPEPSPNTQEFLYCLERSLRSGRVQHPALSMNRRVSRTPNTLARPSGDTRASIHGGIRLVQLRAKTLGETAYAELARQVLPVCHAYQAQLILNTTPTLAEEIGADGVHLDSTQLMSLNQHPFASSRLSSHPRPWVGASCHNARELAHASRIGADFAVVSPVLETPSHPGAQTLGWTGLRELTALATLPVYALGGMTPRHVTQAYEHGAQGIAGISSLWRS